jgi:hypothetical protein
MKKFLQFSGLIAAVVAIVSFVLLMACSSLTFDSGIAIPNVTDGKAVLSGIEGIFGKTETSKITGTYTVYNPTVSAIIAFVLLIVAMLILIVGALLPILKVKALNKFAGLLNLIAVIALLVAGVLVFIEVPCFCAAQSTKDYTMSTDGWTLNAGWIISGICAIVAGVLAIAPAFADFLAKGKKRK